mmetsp:Transcript_22480/g.53028  ORF Transcript_22480/g.53028 Transcript_22480/m.53028 type:complete len:495 (+) Transcript_22480:183-1667(+)
MKPAGFITAGASLFVFLFACSVGDALSLCDDAHISRRDAIKVAGTTATTAVNLLLSEPASSIDDSIDMERINAARTSISSEPKMSIPGLNVVGKERSTIKPSISQTPLLAIKAGREGKSTINIPRVGFSLFKTSYEEAGKCVALALRGGVRHFDIGTSYGTNGEIAQQPLKLYLDNGLVGLKSYFIGEDDELLKALDEAAALSKLQSAPDGSVGRGARRSQLFVSHKLSNKEQSSSILDVKRRVKQTISNLNLGYLDMVSMHSSLTDKERRSATYLALLELRDGGFIKSIGVCNFGVKALEELSDTVKTRDMDGIVDSASKLGYDVNSNKLDDLASLVGYDNSKDLPAVNQIELSPFNMHKDIVHWCDKHGVAVGCSAWSKLSGADGPADGWATLSELATKKGMTKAQLLVRWSLQKGYVCVPRSGSKSTAQKLAIAENSYGGANRLQSFAIDDEEMRTLDALDVGYRAGRLGRKDGWDDNDVTGPEWDPTDFV